MNDEKSISGKIIGILEKDRFTLTTALIYVFIIAGLRSVMEGVVGAYYGYGKHLFLQHVLLSYPQLLLGTLIIYLIIRESPKKIMNVFLLGYGLLLVPPFVDYFVFGKIGTELGASYGYLQTSEILPALLNGWNPFFVLNVGSKGQGVMFLSLMFASAGYVALKIDLPQNIISFFKRQGSSFKLFKSFGKIISTYFGIYILIWLIGSFTFLLDRKPDHFLILNHFKVPFYSKYYIFFMNHYETGDVFPPADSGIMGLPENLIIKQTSMIFSSFFIILAIVTTLIILRSSVPKKLSKMFSLLPKVKTIFLSISAFAGMMSVHIIDPDFSKGFAIDPTYFLHLPYLFFCLIITVLLVSFTFMNKQFSSYGAEPEDPTFTRYHYVHLSISLALTALLLSYILGYVPLVITIIWLLISIILFPDHEHKGFKQMELTVFAGLSFFLGFYSPDSWHSNIIYLGETEVHFTREVVYRLPPITLSILLVLLWIIAVSWFISRLKFSDAENDIESAPYPAMFLTALLLSFPLLYFNNFGALLLFGSVMIVIPIWFKLLKSVHIVYLGCALQLLLFSAGFLLF